MENFVMHLFQNFSFLKNLVDLYGKENYSYINKITKVNLCLTISFTHVYNENILRGKNTWQIKDLLFSNKDYNLVQNVTFK